MEANREIWNQRVNECKQVLEILLDIEFKTIEKIVHFLITHEPSGDERGLAFAHPGLRFPGLEYPRWISTKNHTLISMPATTWERLPDLNALDIEALLRHELLHIETGLLDEDPTFRAETEKRGIILTFEKQEPDLAKELSLAILKSLWPKIKTGELEIIDSSKPDVQYVRVIDTNSRITKEELCSILKKSIVSNLKEAGDREVREAVSRLQEKEIDKIILEET